MTRLFLCAIGLLPSLVFGASFDRLFTTPAERDRLDTLRQTTQSVNDAPDGAELLPIVPENISVQGYVKRSDGKKGTVWVNHQPVRESLESGAVIQGKAGQNRGVELSLPATGKTIHLKPGQVYVPATGKIDDYNVSGQPDTQP